jgi:hypothetical protein
MNKLILIFNLFAVISPSIISQESHAIPVVVQNNRTYVTVKIGSLVIPDILIDTGFAYDGLMLFNPSYRDSLDITRAISVTVGGAGSGDAPRALLIDSASFGLGTCEMVNHPIIVMEDNTDLGSNGIIGYSLFGHYVTEFDYDKNLMILHNPGEVQIDKSWTAIPIYFKNNNIPWIDASIVIDNEEPVPVSVYIDYAAGDNIVLLEKPGMKFSLPVETTDIYIGRGLNGDIYGKTGTISRLIIGKFEMTNIKASIADAAIRSRQDNADAILGNNILRRFNLIFDYYNKMIYLKPNSGFSQK